MTAGRPAFDANKLARRRLIYMTLKAIVRKESAILKAQGRKKYAQEARDIVAKRHGLSYGALEAMLKRHAKKKRNT